MNFLLKHCHLVILFLSLAPIHSAETLNNNRHLEAVETRLRELPDPLTIIQPLKPFQDPAGFPLATNDEREAERPTRPNESNKSDHPLPKGQPDTTYRHDREENWKLVINQSHDDPPRHVPRKSRKLPLLDPIQKLSSWLVILFTAKNPIWIISYKIFHGLFSAIFRLCYATIAFQFSILTRLMVWFWDEILFPMTFPIRLVFWAMVIQPLNLTKTLLKKLKPVIFFLMSAIGMGVLIGKIGSLTHLVVGDWLFPLHHSTKKPAQRKKSPSTVAVPQRRSRLKPRAHTVDDVPIGRPRLRMRTSSHEDHPRTNSSLRKEERNRFKEEEDTGSSASPEEEQDEEDWPGSKHVETEMWPVLGPNQTGYTSAVEKHDRSASSARQRHPPSVLSHLTQPIPSSSDSVSILKTSVPAASPTTSSSSSSPQSSRKKKVTFKTD
ncbi:hypothetical protein VP01_1342g2 [Puccinia sorghi]|uniref:Uncharacterized protein n=1 Tax=Puccinia sorghi TaxID=27349 RepID=A0A0L6VMB4_9BASI|nr:hypothetical protein VP01_1342g2 [Puccinia sorghi]